jgi:hypothetical protein
MMRRNAFWIQERTRRFRAATLGSWQAKRLPYKQKCNRILVAARNNATGRAAVAPYPKTFPVFVVS